MVPIYKQTVFTIALFLVVLDKFHVHGRCEKNWFGQYCDLMCHCGQNGCEPDGLCKNGGKCERSYFGAGCQYVDMASEKADTSTDQQLIDQDEGTCINNYLKNPVRLSLNTHIRFTWLRLFVSNPAYIQKFNLTLNDNHRCINQRNYVVGSGWLDITCDVEVPVKAIVFTGEITEWLCSIYVSGGRNIALRQVATHTHIETITMPEESTPGNVVNGIIRNDTCLYTEGTSTNDPTFTLYLAQPSYAYRAIIFGVEETSLWLQKYKLQLFSPSKEMNFQYRSPNTTNWSQDIEILINLTEPIQTLVLTEDRPHHLSLCEVILLGDLNCPDHMSGVECLIKCKCKNHEICNPYNGRCGKGCPAGFYGFRCNNKCKGSCGDGRCLYRSGNCYVCPTDFEGYTCSQSIEKQQNIPLTIIIPGGIVIGLLLSCVIYLAVFKKKPTHFLENSFTETSSEMSHEL